MATAGYNLKFSKGYLGGGKPAAAPAPQVHDAPEGGEEQDGAAIAQEHGPAHEVHVQHDHEGGRHHVHSMHADGHEHHSDHASAEEAHEHAKKLAGGGAEHDDHDGDVDEEREED